MNRYPLFIFLLFFSYSSFSQLDSSDRNIEKKTTENDLQTIISHKQIENSSAKTLASLLNEQAGMVVNGAYQPMGSFVNIYMEGYIGGKALVEIDGLPVWDPASIAENYFDLNYIPLSMIEEIIITHGSHSTQDGSGAVAGVINIITHKKYNSKMLNMVGEIGAGNRSSLSKDIQVWGTLNKFNYQANYSGYHTNGFSYAEDTIGNKGFDNDGFKSKVFSGYLEYKPTINVKLYSYFLKSMYKADTDEDDFSDAKNYYYKNSFLNTGIGFSYKKNNLSISGNYKYSDVIRAYYNLDINTEKLNGLAHLIDLKVNNQITKQISYSGGVDYRHTEMKDQLTDIAFGTIQNKYPTAYQMGISSAFSYKSMSNKYLASIGYRVNKNALSSTDDSYCLTNSYQITKAFRVTANISSGYTIPSIYAAKDSSLGNEKLKSERSLGFQLSLNYSMKSWKQRLLFYRNKLDNGIDFNGNISAFSNCNGYKIWGLLYETEIILLNHLKAQANYAFTAGNETTISRQNSYDTISYPYLVRIPKHNINFKLQYESKKGNCLGIGAKYVNAYYDVGNATGDYKMKGFIVLNMNSCIYLGRHILLLFDVQNLLNNSFQDTRGYNSVPILADVSVKFKL